MNSRTIVLFASSAFMKKKRCREKFWICSCAGMKMAWLASVSSSALSAVGHCHPAYRIAASDRIDKNRKRTHGTETERPQAAEPECRVCRHNGFPDAPRPVHRACNGQLRDAGRVDGAGRIRCRGQAAGIAGVLRGGDRHALAALLA